MAYEIAHQVQKDAEEDMKQAEVPYDFTLKVRNLIDDGVECLLEYQHGTADIEDAFDPDLIELLGGRDYIFDFADEHTEQSQRIKDALYKSYGAILRDLLLFSVTKRMNE